jgi:hypothetical protein
MDAHIMQRYWVETAASWPGKSAKRVFALDVPAIHVLDHRKKDVDARVKRALDVERFASGH